MKLSAMEESKFPPIIKYGSGKSPIDISHLFPLKHTLMEDFQSLSCGFKSMFMIFITMVPSDAHHSADCLGQDRDGCPKIVNLGTARTDLFYERKKTGSQ